VQKVVDELRESARGLGQTLQRPGRLRRQLP
jgi:hypothetical protein